jgi:hypothetical protein
MREEIDMITSLDELVAFTRRLGAALPELRKRRVINRPGCSLEAVSALAEKLPGVPDSYLSVIKAIRLDGVVIGYFQLSPSAFEGRDLTEKVISCNDPVQNPLVEGHRIYRVYEVASWEADPIGVVHTDGVFKVGQVVKYNIGNPGERPVVLANDFEQFLLLASNLDAVRDKYSHTNDRVQAMHEFREVVSKLLSSDMGKMASVWESIARVVLS